MADMLVTADELASHLQQDLDRSSATLAVQTATGIVQAVCRQRLIQVTDDVVTLPTTGGQWLDLPEAPVSAVSAVAIASLPVTSWTLTSDPTSGRARLWRYYGWQYPLDGGMSWSLTQLPQVTVTYTHGYPTGDPGLELARAAVLMLAGGMYRNPDGLRSEQIDDYTVAYSDAASQPALGAELTAALRRRYGVVAGSTSLGWGMVG